MKTNSIFLLIVAIALPFLNKTYLSDLISEFFFFILLVRGCTIWLLGSTAFIFSQLDHVLVCGTARAKQFICSLLPTINSSSVLTPKITVNTIGINCITNKYILGSLAFIRSGFLIFSGFLARILSQCQSHVILSRFRIITFQLGKVLIKLDLLLLGKYLLLLVVQLSYLYIQLKYFSTVYFIKVPDFLVKAAAFVLNQVAAKVSSANEKLQTLADDRTVDEKVKLISVSDTTLGGIKLKKCRVFTFTNESKGPVNQVMYEIYRQLFKNTQFSV